MANQFNEPAWTAEKILEFWENEYGNLEISWRNQFLVNPFVKEMCNHHPVHIRNSILACKKVENALAFIYRIEERNAEYAEKLLDDRHPDHARGITNAHHGNRTTDPFDPKREDLLFYCKVCNLKLSLLRKSELDRMDSTCKSCSGEDDKIRFF